MPKELTAGQKTTAFARLYAGKPVTVELDVPALPNQTRIRVNADLPDKKVAHTPDASIKTMYDLLNYAAKTHGNTSTIGTRPFIKEHSTIKTIKKLVDGVEQDVEKTWLFFEYGPYEYITFNTFRQRAIDIGAGLRKSGLSKNDKVMLYASTSANWLATAHGAITQAMTITTAYDTLGITGLAFSLFQTKAKAIYLEPHFLPILLKALLHIRKENTSTFAPSLVVYNDVFEIKSAHVDELLKEYPEIKVISLSSIIETGSNNPVAVEEPSPEDTCCIMYTSGSTGTPKGVVLTHGNVVAAVAGANVNVGTYVSHTDTLLAYLPLAHILEFVFENCALFWGAKIGYGSTRTLVDSAMVKGCQGDIRALKPTILVGVPTVWEKIKKGVMDQLAQVNPIQSRVFWAGFNAKKWLSARGYPGTSIIDYLVLKKVQDLTGGKLRVTFNGGSRVAPDTLRFISIAIAPMVSGYGLTETCAMGGIMDPLAWSDNSIGAVSGCIEAKLVDCPEVKYLSTDKPFPRGEIWLRGPSVTSKYFENDELTAEAFEYDEPVTSSSENDERPKPWFKTGDIGTFDEFGNLRIIDRLKNLVKLQNGEYIGLEALESIYLTCEAVSMVCVFAEPGWPAPVAMVVPNLPTIKKYIAANNLDESVSHDTIIKSAGFNKLVYGKLVATAKAQDWPGFMTVAGVVLDTEEWTSQNGCLSAAQKLVRTEILLANKKGVDAIFPPSQ